MISPSILSADFANLERDLNRVTDADYAHVDVMDGHFVPNLTVGLPVVARLAEVSLVPLDVHLMIDDPDRWAPGYAEVGASSVTCHAEAAASPAQVSRDIRRHGARVGIAVRPGTALDPYLDLLPSVDLILVMTVEPGLGGQSFMPEMMLKVRQARAAISRSGLDIWVQVDGGISRSTIEQAADAGANVFVAGSAVYAAEDAAAEVAALRELAERHPHAG